MSLKTFLSETVNDTLYFDVHADGTMPVKAYNNDAGWDLFSANKEPVYLKPGVMFTLDTCVSVHLPAGYFGLILPRSSISLSRLHIFPGVIDNGYRGNMLICMTNIGPMVQYPVQPHTKVAQLVVMPFYMGEAKHMTDEVKNIIKDEDMRMIKLQGAEKPLAW